MSCLTVVDLLRHGEPEGGQKFRGTLDDPLSQHGWEQMWTTVGNYNNWQAIISSPLVRCSEFAETLAEHLDCPFQIIPDFAEIGFGIWEGLSVAQVNNLDPVALAYFWRDPISYPIPKAEPVLDFDKRIQSAWASLTEFYHGKHLLLVTHGGVIRAILRLLLDMPLRRMWRIDVPYAAVTRLCQRYDIDSELHLEFHNGYLSS